MKLLDKLLKKQQPVEAEEEKISDPTAEVDIKFLDNLIDEVFEIDDHRANQLNIKDN
jgi:hypothetical protein